MGHRLGGGRGACLWLCRDDANDAVYAPEHLDMLPTSGDGVDAALTPDGIAMCHTRGVEAQAEGEGIHGRS